MQGGALKVFNLAAQFVLAWVLVPGDFGYVSMAFAVAAFLSLITQAGMKELLIRRYKEFPDLATSAFWLMVLLGSFTTALGFFAAPLIAHFFHDDRLTNLIRVLAFQNIFLSLAIVADSKAQIDLRFRFTAILEFVCSVMLTTLTVLLAFLGWGAFAFIVPWPILAITKCAAFWSRTKVRITGRPSLRIWMDVLGDNALLLASATCLMITAQGDYVILGRMYNKDVVGRYFWAFGLSTQAMQLLSLNVAYVLLPSLAKLQDEPERFRAAFTRAASVLALLAVPACALQGVVADPLVRLAFKPEYYPAIKIVQILSFGWAPFVASHASGFALKAQGKFLLYLKLMIGAVLVFLPSVFLGAKLGAEVGAAFGVGVYSFVIGPLSVYTALRPLGGEVRDLVKIFGAPLVAGAVSTLAGLWVVHVLPAGAGRDIPHNLLRAGAASMVMAGIYLPLARVLAPEAWEEMLSRGKRLFFRGKATPAAA
jgi:PST family polysaccharide transporter